MGVEVYRTAKQGTAAELHEAAQEFRHAVEFSVHGPMSREFFGRSKEMFMVVEELAPQLDRMLSMLDAENRPSRRKTKKDGSEDA